MSLSSNLFWVLIVSIVLAMGLGVIIYRVRHTNAEFLPRMFWWLIVTIFLLAVIGLLYPQQVPVTVYKLSLVTLAGVVGYWLDRELFPYARPDLFMVLDAVPDPNKGGLCDPDLEECEYTPTSITAANRLPFAVSMLRRALIVMGAMIAMGLGA